MMKNKERVQNTFLVECLAWGMLQAYGVQAPPVPVRTMIAQPLPIFKNLVLLELSLGLYAATYRSGLNGSRLIVVDPTLPDEVQRAGIARELYVAYCYTSRATEVCGKGGHPRAYSDLFARCLLMPAAWVTTSAVTMSVEDLAARFRVPTSMAACRLNELVHYSPQASSERVLADALFSLGEPWQSRFLAWVAGQSVGVDIDDIQLTPKDVARWLSADAKLFQDVRYLVNTWKRSATVWLTQPVND